jgi:PIN domain nuclease of toxin-antitoxin system
MSKWVVDASAVLAYLHQETGWQLVDEVLLAGECMISTVNYAEVAAKLAEKGMPEDAIRMALDCLNLQVIDFTSALAERNSGSSPKAIRRNHGRIPPDGKRVTMSDGYAEICARN